jgi:Skp family chaperone for outer membrane proteins
MRIKRVLQAAVAFGSLVGLTSGLVGCKDDHNNTGPITATSGGQATVATVDLLKVFTDLNYVSNVDAKVDAYKKELTEELKAVKTRYDGEIQDYVKSLFPKDAKPDTEIKLTPAQQQRLSQLASAEQNALNQLNQGAGQELVNYRNKWLSQYRTQLGPIVRQVAQEKKLSVVIALADNVLFSEDNLNLSNAVVDAAKSHPIVVIDPPMNKIEAAPLRDLLNQAGPSTPASQPSSPSGPATKPS